jgi:hypothetical protein
VMGTGLLQDPHPPEDSVQRSCLTTRWSRPGQPGARISCDTRSGPAGRLISRPLGVPFVHSSASVQSREEVAQWTDSRP